MNSPAELHDFDRRPEWLTVDMRSVEHSLRSVAHRIANHGVIEARVCLYGGLIQGTYAGTVIHLLMMETPEWARSVTLVLLLPLVITGLWLTHVYARRAHAVLDAAP